MSYELALWRARRDLNAGPLAPEYITTHFEGFSQLSKIIDNPLHFKKLQKIYVSVCVGRNRLFPKPVGHNLGTEEDSPRYIEVDA